MRPGPACVLALALVLPASRAAADDPPSGARQLQAIGSRRTVRAEPTARPPVIDGILDEREWESGGLADGFLQSEPHEGQPLTEQTEVRVLFDRNNLYIGAICHDSDPSRIVVNELVRDFDSYESDAFGLAIDAMLDRRGSYSFFVNPGGARRDAQAFGDGRWVNLQWDGIWDARTAIRPDGWSVEIVIPFKTLGLKSSNVGTMGINFKRRIRRKNEEGYWSLIPRRFTVNYVSHAGDITGLVDLATGGNLRVKPFVTGNVRHGVTPALGDSKAKVGIDAKYRLAPGVALDATLNTDFSQVDVDRQEINLTRFNLFFPEKRDFFLENAGVFELGDIPHERSKNRRSEETQLFYSRRIGLSDDGEPLPLAGGVRLSGRAQGWNFGAMTIRQNDTATTQANTFSVARVRRDLFPYTEAGAVVVYRRGEHGDYNAAYGVDFNTRVWQKFAVSTYAAATRSPDGSPIERQVRAAGVTSPSRATKKVTIGWDDGFFDANVLYADIGEAFDPQVGFVARRGVRNWYSEVGVRPRPRNWPIIREIHPHMNLKFYRTRAGVFQTRDTHYGLEASFHDGGRVEISHNPQFDRLFDPFRVRRDVFVAPGDYRWNEFRLAYSTDKSQVVSGSYNLEKGGFYGGDRTTNSFGATVTLKPRLTASVNINSNHLVLSATDVYVNLVGVQAVYSFSPRMFVNAFVQYNKDTNTTLTNVRFNFTHHPLSDFTIVYNENVSYDGRTGEWRAVILKFTQLLQF
jgi:hypothetical protein